MCAGIVTSNPLAAGVDDTSPCPLNEKKDCKKKKQTLKSNFIFKRNRNKNVKVFWTREIKDGKKKNRV